MRGGRKLSSLLAAAVVLGSGAPGPAGALGPTPEDPEWVHAGAIDDDYRVVVVSPDGATIYVGGTGDRRALVRAFDAETGAPRWTFTSSRSSSVAALAVSPDGTRLVAAGTVSASRSKMALWTFDAAEGTSQWSATHAGNGARHRESTVRDVVFSPDGTRVLAAGTAWYESRRRDFVVLAYGAATGRSMWKRVYDSGGTGSLGRSDEAQALSVSSNGATVIATGIGRWPAGDQAGAVLTMAFRVSNGVRRWLRYDRPAGTDAWQGGKDLAVHGESAFVGAQANWDYGSGFGGVGFARMRASDGRRAWQRSVAPTGEVCHLVGIAADSDGVHAGASCGSGSGPFRATVWSRGLADGAGSWLVRTETDDVYAFAMGFAVTEALVLVAETERSSAGPIRVFGLDKATGDQILVGRAEDATLWREGSLAVSALGGASYVIGASISEGGQNYVASLFRFDIP